MNSWSFWLRPLAHRGNLSPPQVNGVFFWENEHQSIFVLNIFGISHFAHLVLCYLYRRAHNAYVPKSKGGFEKASTKIEPVIEEYWEERSRWLKIGKQLFDCDFLILSVEQLLEIVEAKMDSRSPFSTDVKLLIFLGFFTRHNYLHEAV